MELIKVDIVGAQPFEAAFNRLKNLDPVQFGNAPVFSEISLGAAPHRLGGQNDAITIAARLQPGANIAFGAPGGLLPGRDWIKLGGIEEIDPLIQRQVHLLVGFLDGVLLPKSHGAKAQCADRKIAAPENSVLHKVPSIAGLSSNFDPGLSAWVLIECARSGLQPWAKSPER